MKKKCATCNEVKVIKEFYKDKTTGDGLAYSCKICTNIKSASYSKTKNGLFSVIYTSQRSSSKKRLHPMPNYTKKELAQWITNQPNFNLLYNNWVHSEYNKYLKPSCDRIYNYKPYTMSIQRVKEWRRISN